MTRFSACLLSLAAIITIMYGNHGNPCFCGMFPVLVFHVVRVHLLSSTSLVNRIVFCHSAVHICVDVVGCDSQHLRAIGMFGVQRVLREVGTSMV